MNLREIIDEVRLLDSGALQGALVSIRDLRIAVVATSGAAALASLDAALIREAIAGRLSLHKHDWPAQYSAAERADRLLQWGDKYYCGVAIRQ